MTITIASESVLYDGDETTLYLKIIAADSFHTSGGDLITGGESYPAVTVSVSGGYAAVPEVTIDSTTDSTDNPNVRFAVAGLYKSEASQHPEVVILDNFAVNESTPTTWANLRIRRNANNKRPNYDNYTADQTDGAITAAVAGVALPDATTAVKGKGTVDTAPAVSNTPIFVGANSARIAKNVSLDYSNSLSTAAAAIGSTETVLEVTRPVTVSSNLDLTSVGTGIILDVKGTGLITVASGRTLTVKKLINPGNRQIFAGAGTVVYAKGAVEEINTAWRSGMAAGANITDALDEALASVNATGGKIYIPAGTWTTTGEHSISGGVYIRGAGNSPSYGLQNSTVLTITADTYMFKVGESVYTTSIKDIILDGTGTTAATGLLFEGTGGVSTTSADWFGQKVTFQNFAIGLNQNSLGSSWQTAQMTAIQCIFQACTKGIRFSSVNHQWTSISTNFAVPAAGGIAVEIVAGGAMEFIGTEVAGNAGTSKGFVISGSHGGLTLSNYQDENLITTLQNDASDITGIINFTHGSLIQSKIQLNQSCKLNITPGCNIMSYAIQGAATGAVVNIQEGVNIRNISVNDGVTVVNPPTPLGVGSGVRIITENLTDNGVFIQRIPQRYISPYTDLGDPTTPVLALGHITDGTDEDKVLLRLGRMTTAEAFDYYYDIKRDHSTGYLLLEGNQADPNKAFSFNAALFIPDEAFDITTWNNNLSVPTKNAIRDMVGVNVQAYSANLDEYAAVNPTAAGLALLDDANAAAQLVTLGLGATAAELNQFNDVSAYQESITAAGALSVTKLYSGLSVSGGGAVTLAVPDASMLGKVKTIEMVADTGDVTLALTNVEGGTAGTTATFSAVGQKLILVAGASKWTVIKEFGVVLS